MFGVSGQDAQELNNDYNFGPLESAVASRNPTTVAASASTGDNAEPQEVTVANNADVQEYSPQEQATNPAGPFTPSAFGPVESSTGFTPAYSPAAAPAEHEKKEGKKKHVMKEVLGMNKKSTKGKTDEEKQQIALEQRWKNANAEEQRLNELEQRVAVGEQATAEMKQPNLPRKFLCIHPLVYHNIQEEVPPARQRYVTIAFWNWVANSIILVMNCGIAIGVGFAPYKDEEHKKKYHFNKARNTVLAIVYLVGIPLSFISWYWRVYRACSTGRPGQHLIALFGLIIALAQAVFCFVGPRGYGACGIALAIHIGKSRKTGVVAPVAIMIFIWLGESAMYAYFVVQQFIYYREDLAAKRAARRAMKSATGA